MSNSIERGFILTKGLLDTGACGINTVCPLSYLGQEGARNGTNLVAAPVLMHAPEQDKDANTFLK